MGVNSLPKTVTRQRRDCDLNPDPSAPESNTLTTWLRLPSHPWTSKKVYETSHSHLERDVWPSHNPNNNESKYPMSRSRLAALLKKLPTSYAVFQEVHTRVACYNSVRHEPISITFGGNVADEQVVKGCFIFHLA